MDTAGPWGSGPGQLQPAFSHEECTVFLHRNEQSYDLERKATAQCLRFGIDLDLPGFPHQDPNNPGPIASHPLQGGIQILPASKSLLELAFQGPLSYVPTRTGSLKDRADQLGIVLTSWAVHAHLMCAHS